MAGRAWNNTCNKKNHRTVRSADNQGSRGSVGSMATLRARLSCTRLGPGHCLFCMQAKVQIRSTTILTTGVCCCSISTGITDARRGCALCIPGRPDDCLNFNRNRSSCPRRACRSISSAYAVVPPPAVVSWWGSELRGRRRFRRLGGDTDGELERREGIRRLDPVSRWEGARDW